MGLSLQQDPDCPSPATVQRRRGHGWTRPVGHRLRLRDPIGRQRFGAQFFSGFRCRPASWSAATPAFLPGAPLEAGSG